MFYIKNVLKNSFSLLMTELISPEYEVIKDQGDEKRKLAKFSLPLNEAISNDLFPDIPSALHRIEVYQSDDIKDGYTYVGQYYGTSPSSRVSVNNMSFHISRDFFYPVVKLEFSSPPHSYIIVSKTALETSFPHVNFSIGRGYVITKGSKEGPFEVVGKYFLNSINSAGKCQFISEDYYKRIDELDKDEYLKYHSSDILAAATGCFTVNSMARDQTFLSIDVYCNIKKDVIGFSRSSLQGDPYYKNLSFATPQGRKGLMAVTLDKKMVKNAGKFNKVTHDHAFNNSLGIYKVVNCNTLTVFLEKQSAIWLEAANAFTKTKEGGSECTYVGSGTAIIPIEDSKKSVIGFVMYTNSNNQVSFKTRLRCNPASIVGKQNNVEVRFSGAMLTNNERWSIWICEKEFEESTDTQAKDEIVTYVNLINDSMVREKVTNYSTTAGSTWSKPIVKTELKRKTNYILV